MLKWQKFLNFCQKHSNIEYFWQKFEKKTKKTKKGEMSKIREFLPNLTKEPKTISTMIQLTDEQLDSLTAAREEKPTSIGTFQAQSTCNFSVKEESEKFITSILQGVSDQPETIRDGYKYKKSESFSIGEGDLNISLNINYRHRRSPPPPSRNATLLHPK